MYNVVEVVATIMFGIELWCLQLWVATEQLSITQVVVTIVTHHAIEYLHANDSIDVVDDLEKQLDVS